MRILLLIAILRVAQVEVGAEESAGSRAWAILEEDSLNRLRPLASLAAIEALGLLNDSRSADLLVRVFEEHPSSLYQVSALRAFARRSDFKTALLERSFGASDLMVRFEAAKLLATVEAVPREVLETALDSPDQQVRNVVFQSLVARGGNEVVNVLRKRLVSGDNYTRRFSAGALGQIGGEAAASALRDALEDPDPDVRADAAISLARLGENSAQPELAAALSSSDRSRRLYARAGLARLGDHQQMTALESILSGSDQKRRYGVVSALQIVAAPGLRPLLLKAAKDPSPDVRAGAVAALSENPDRRDRLLFRELLKDDSPYVRAQAARTLLAMGGSEAEAQSVLAQLVRGRQDSAPDLRVEALRQIGETAAEDYRSLILEALGDPDSLVRQEAIMAVAAWGDKTVVPDLTRLLRDPDRQVSRHAAEALIGLLGKDALPLFFPLLEEGGAPASDDDDRGGLFARAFAAAAVIRLSPK